MQVDRSTELPPEAPAPAAATLAAPMGDDVLLTPSEVARIFRVNPKTVTRWARSGKLPAIRTLGGHRRFRSADIRAFLDADEVDTVATGTAD